MSTCFLLMAQYGGRAVIPLDMVARDYFPHLIPRVLAQKMTIGEIKIPLVRIDASQKAAKGVHIDDLANWIDERRAAAAKELKQMTS